MTDSKLQDVPVDKITTVKKKDPKRVEAGKKLAAISKAAKEKKMRERIEMEKSINENDSTGKLKPLLLLVGVLTVIAVIAFKNNKAPVNNETPPILPIPKNQLENL